MFFNSDILIKFKITTHKHNTKLKIDLLVCKSHLLSNLTTIGKNIK